MRNPVEIVSEIIAPAVGLGAYFQPEPIVEFIAAYLRTDEGRGDRYALMLVIWTYHNVDSDGERDEANAAIIDATIAIREHVRSLIVSEAARWMVAA